MKKFLFCLVSLFLIRLMISCCPCEIEPILLNLNTLTISNLDNSSDVHDPPRLSQSDSMYSNAVAFEVVLSDSTYENEYDEFALAIRNLGFKSALAFWCDCNQPYAPNQKVKKISIVSLFELLPGQGKGCDVSDWFVALPSANRLYSGIDQLYELINTELVQNFAGIRFQLFCKEDLKTPQAQFAITAELTDGTLLTAHTQLIRIIQK